MNPTMSPVIEVRGLTVEFNGVPAVKLVDLNISKGHIVGIVGESGSGQIDTRFCINWFTPRLCKDHQRANFL